MVGTPPPAFCRANQSTKVLFGRLAFANYIGSFSVPERNVLWQRYSSSPPHYTEGVHNTSEDFSAILAGIYSDFWFRPPVDLTVTWQ